MDGDIPADKLALNIAEVIDDLYQQHAPPRDHERLIELIEHQIKHVQRLTAKPLYEEIKRQRKEAERAAAKIEKLDRVFGSATVLTVMPLDAEGPF
jgi:hypothetical protein